VTGRHTDTTFIWLSNTMRGASGGPVTGNVNARAAEAANPPINAAAKATATHPRTRDNVDPDHDIACATHGGRRVRGMRRLAGQIASSGGRRLGGRHPLPDRD
jgi:hypothetical protein